MSEKHDVGIDRVSVVITLEGKQRGLSNRISTKTTLREFKLILDMLFDSGFEAFSEMIEEE